MRRPSVDPRAEVVALLGGLCPAGCAASSAFGISSSELPVLRVTLPVPHPRGETLSAHFAALVTHTQLSLFVSVSHAHTRSVRRYARYNETSFVEETFEQALRRGSLKDLPAVLVVTSYGQPAHFPLDWINRQPWPAFVSTKVCAHCLVRFPAAR